MKRTPRLLLSTLSLGSLLLAGTVQAGGAGAPPAARLAPAVPASAVTPEGRALLEKALAANGGEALRNLQTVQERAEITYMDAQGQPALVLQGTSTTDYVNGWIRVALLREGQVISEQLITRQGNFFSSPQSGSVPLPRQQARELADNLYYGAPGLRRGSEGRDAVTDLGEQVWPPMGGHEITGDVLEVVTRGVTATYVLNPQGLIVAERYPSASTGITTLVYSDFKTVGGIKLPGTTQAYAPDGTLLYVAKDQGTQVNAPLPADAFKVPE